jgi:hypothetical protein
MFCRPPWTDCVCQRDRYRVPRQGIMGRRSREGRPSLTCYFPAGSAADPDPEQTLHVGDDVPIQRSHLYAGVSGRLGGLGGTKRTQAAAQLTLTAHRARRRLGRLLNLQRELRRGAVDRRVEKVTMGYHQEEMEANVRRRRRTGRPVRRAGSTRSLGAVHDEPLGTSRRTGLSSSQRWPQDGEDSVARFASSVQAFAARRANGRWAGPVPPH